MDYVELKQAAKEHAQEVVASYFRDPRRADKLEVQRVAREQSSCHMLDSGETDRDVIDEIAYDIAAELSN